MAPLTLGDRDLLNSHNWKEIKGGDVNLRSQTLTVTEGWVGDQTIRITLQANYSSKKAITVTQCTFMTVFDDSRFLHFQFTSV